MECLLYLKSILKVRQPMPYTAYCSSCSCFVVVPADPQPSSHGVLANAPHLQLVLAMRACILSSVCCRCKSGFQKIACKQFWENKYTRNYHNIFRYRYENCHTVAKAFMVMRVFCSDAHSWISWTLRSSSLSSVAAHLKFKLTGSGGS